MKAAQAPIYLTRHALDRMLERVECVDLDEARETLTEIAATARWRPRPRHWMRRPAREEVTDLSFGYSANAPGICLIRRGLVVVTVYTRPMFAAASFPDRGLDRTRRPRRPNDDPPKRSRRRTRRRPRAQASVL